MQLASRFAPRSPVLRSETPLSDDQIRTVAPCIFAEAPHGSRSERYSYIPTATVLQELRGEGFQPFMVCQTRVRQDDRREFTKHLIRLRHASQINGREANEIIPLNSHDGTSSYQMLAGMFRFVCQNGLVCGNTVADVRVPHKGDVAAPVTESQILMPRRHDDDRRDLWSVFNRTQENLIKGGLAGRSANGRRQSTRPVQGIDQNLRLNRALWLLADGMRQLKG